MNQILNCLAAGTVLLAVSQSSAITFSGSVQTGGSALGVNFNQGATENALAQLFTEKQEVVLASNLTVDGVPPTFAFAGSIPSGTAVNSYLFHYDRVGTAPLSTISGTINFDRPIIGIIFNQVNLVASDAPLGLGTAYYNHATRGLEGINQDSWTINGGTLTFNFEFGVAEGVDNVRILTSVPDAGSTLGLLAGGLALLSLRFRKH